MLCDIPHYYYYYLFHLNRLKVMANNSSKIWRNKMFRDILNLLSIVLNHLNSVADKQRTLIKSKFIFETFKYFHQVK